MVEISLRKRVPDDTRQRVEQVRIERSQEISAMLREETGLAVNRRRHDEYQQPQQHVMVSVTVKDGIPETLRKIDEVYEKDELFITIARRTRDINCAIHALRTVTDLLDSLNKREDARQHFPLFEGRDYELLLMMREYLDEKKRPVGHILRSINTDVLGRYICSARGGEFLGRIELYWLVIGLIAQLLGVSVEPLAAVTLIHERAHAYTHLGADIDGMRWNAFGDCGNDLIEGLAQYYTYIVCKRLRERDAFYEDALRAFEALLELQSDIYHGHEQLVEFSPEEIRLGLIQLRRTRHGMGMEGFLRVLSEAKRRFRGGGLLA